MIIKRYRNGRVIEERISDGSESSDPKIYTNKGKKRIITNPRGTPAKNPVRIRKKKGCGCGKKK